MHHLRTPSAMSDTRAKPVPSGGKWCWLLGLEKQGARTCGRDNTRRVLSLAPIHTPVILLLSPPLLHRTRNKLLLAC
jgi:hypothetical protein